MNASTDPKAEISRSLFAGFFDDAGLYPPALLSMRDAVAEHEEVRASEYAWMLGRFVVSASRLHDLVGLLEPPEWKLAVLLDEPDEVKKFVATAGSRVSVEQVEIRATTTVSDAIDIASAIGAPIFVEIPAGDSNAVDEIATHPGVGAKIRCGGNLPTMFPSVDDVATTIAACAQRRVRLKATAGLHHALPYVDQDTGFSHHGFLNLLVAAAFAAFAPGVDSARLKDILTSDEFSVDESGLRWGDEIVGLEQCADARKNLLFSIGTCSFAEPLEDLLDLGAIE